MKNLSIILFLTLLSLPARAQWINDPAAEARIRKGVEQVYNLSFDSAKVNFNEVIRQYPDHPEGYFFLGMVGWWNIMVDIDNESHDAKFLSSMERVIGICDKRLDKNDTDLAGLFFKGGALGFQGRLYANREDWLKAAGAGKSAMDIVLKADKLSPNNHDIELGLGIYDYYAQVIPDQYPVVKPFMMFFPKGDKEKGISQLYESVHQAKYANQEASYFLLQILMNYEKRYTECLPLALDLCKRYPNNSVYERCLGRSYAVTSDYANTEKTYADVVAKVRKKQFGYGAIEEREADYYLGLMEMVDQRLDSSLVHFYRCDELSRTLDTHGASGFMAMSNLKIGMIYDLQSKRDLAVAQYKKVQDMPDYQQSKSMAERYITHPYGK